jgi:hypothetical protein
MQPTACQDVTSVYQHSSFNAGQPPAAMVAKKRCAFHCVDDLYLQVQKAVASQPEFGFMWMVEVKGCKIIPVGLTLVSEISEQGPRFEHLCKYFFLLIYEIYRLGGLTVRLHMLLDKKCDINYAAHWLPWKSGMRIACPSALDGLS